MNTLLKKLYEADISDRHNKISNQRLNINDQQRIAQVQTILDREQSLDSQDYHFAALIFQHGESLGQFQKAHKLAIMAVELGDNSARWLAAASLDRSLLMEGKPQKYGTQFKLNENNAWELILPVDPYITDDERAIWNVPPLKDALKGYKQKYNL